MLLVGITTGNLYAQKLYYVDSNGNSPNGEIRRSGQALWQLERRLALATRVGRKPAARTKPFVVEARIAAREIVSLESSGSFGYDRGLESDNWEIPDTTSGVPSARKEDGNVPVR